jgi:DNA primase
VQKNSPEEGVRKSQPLVVEKSESGEERNEPLSFQLKDVTPLHPYLQSRGVEEKIAQEFGIGFFPGRGSMAGRVVIPIHDKEGRVVAYAGRSIDDTEPKYKLPTGFKKSLELYNIHRVLEREERGEQVILVEGFFDCIRVVSAGFPNVVALIGCTLSEAQEKILTTEFREVVLFLDGNDAGRKGSEEIALRLSKKMFVRIIETPTDKEPDTLSPEEIKTLLGSL